MDNDSIEISARTVEEALELALRELDAGREEVAVEVVNQGRAGFFGIGSEQARVRVTRLSSSEGLASLAIGVVNSLISRMDISVLATIRSSGDDETGPVIDVQGEDSGLLIGKRGETLQAFQFLVNMALNKSMQSHPVVVVDVEKYKERRSKSLEAACCAGGGAGGEKRQADNPGTDAAVRATGDTPCPDKPLFRNH